MAEVEVETKGHEVEEVEEIWIIEMTEIGENINKTILNTGVKVKTTRLEGAESSGTTMGMTIGTEIVETVVMMRKAVVAVVDCNAEEVKVMGTEGEDANGIHTRNTHPKDIPWVHTIKIQITTDHHLWVFKPTISHRYNNTLHMQYSIRRGSFSLNLPPELAVSCNMARISCSTQQ